MLDSTRPPSTSDTKIGFAGGETQHRRYQPVTDLAWLLSAYWLPRTTLNFAAPTFDSDQVGSVVITSMASGWNFPFVSTRPGFTNVVVGGVDIDQLILGDLDFSLTDVRSGRTQGTATLNAPTGIYFGTGPASHVARLLAGPAGIQSGSPSAASLISHSARWTNQATAAIQDLKAWLNLTTEEVAKVVGTSKSAVYYWRRADATPRPRVAREITRVHSLLRALQNGSTHEGFNAILHAKPSGYDRSAFDLIMNQDFDRAEMLLQDYVFARRSRREPYWTRQVSEWPETPEPSGLSRSSSLRTPRARKSRVRLRKRD